MTFAEVRKSVDSWWESDFVYGFRHSPTAILAAIAGSVLLVVALGADAVAPYDAFDPVAANVADARLSPGSIGVSGDVYLLGTDPQGRDVLSAMIYGLRTSLLIGLGSVTVAAGAGVLLGLGAGWFGGVIDAVIMRAADIQLSFPTILVALLIDGVARTAFPRATHERLALPILIAAVAASFWVQYARTVRALVLVERGRDYVLAAQVTGVSAPRILFSHILPNVRGPVLVIATINLALAILAEATLSFLGVGLPPTEPSLGTLVRVGSEFIFSGDWWISIFPGLLLVLLSVSVNVFGDWLRKALNPRFAS